MTKIKMVQIFRYRPQKMLINGVHWITYCINKCECMHNNGRQAELRYNKRNEVSVWADDIIKKGPE